MIHHSHYFSNVDICYRPSDRLMQRGKKNCLYNCGLIIYNCRLSKTWKICSTLYSYWLNSNEVLPLTALRISYLELVHKISLWLARFEQIWLVRICLRHKSRVSRTFYRIKTTSMMGEENCKHWGKRVETVLIWLHIDVTTCDFAA